MAKFLVSCRNPSVFDIEDMKIVVSGDLACGYGLLRCGKSGDMFPVRLTVCLRRLDGAWTIVHEHHSVPAAGFSVGVSKTVAASLSDLYAATANAARRKKWFPKGAFELSSQTKDKYLRGSWKKDARLEIGFYAKREGKAQIALAVNKLANKADVERERKVWKAGLAKLQALLEADAT